MSLKRQRRKLNSKSQEIQEILAERLNKLCRFLDEEYDVNCGGCCYIAYCLARLLSRDKFKFKVIIYEDYELEENVYTLKEFVGEEGDVLDPYGGDEDAYEECYAELKDLLYKVKKKLEWQ